MNVYTVHVRDADAPRLVREGFSWGALVLGPFWLLGAGAWIGAGLVFALFVALGLLPAMRAVAELALMLLVGFSAGDLVRFELGLRGWRLDEVVAAASADAALTRLIDARPELAGARPGGPPEPDAPVTSPWS